MFKVENGVAIQSIQRRMGEGAIRHSKYPFSEMVEVGQSFFVPDDGSGVDKIQKRISAAAFQTGKKFCTQQVFRNGEATGVRVWRGTRKEVEDHFSRQPARRRRA